MAKDILYSIAETPIGQLINAIDADKQSAYLCPACKQPLLFRKGLKKRPHFAHKVLTPNCTPETALHYSFKTLLYHKIKEHLDLDLALPIQWTCSKCHELHTGNLLKKAVEVRLEYNLGSCRPDIALLDRNGQTIAVIEVVVTHLPEEKTLDYYRQNQIFVITYLLKSDRDIDRLDLVTLAPDSINLCISPKCLKCGEHMWRKYLLIIDAQCWNCRASIKVATSHSEDGAVDDFSNYEIGLANQNGCSLKRRYSYNGTIYGVNTCFKCFKDIGTHYLIVDCLQNTDLLTKRIEVEYYCFHC